jgi:hypothetical protein
MEPEPSIRARAPRMRLKDGFKKMHAPQTSDADQPRRSATAIPDSPDALLTRAHTGAALRESGFPVADSSLATKATRGGGPPFKKFGPIPLYRWGDSLNWALSRLSPPRTNTSAGDAPDANNKRGRRPPKSAPSELEAV